MQQATVVYIALEGRHGFPARIEAFKQHHGVQSAPFHLITKPLDLVRKADALIADIEAQLGDERPASCFSIRSTAALSAPNQRTRTWPPISPQPARSRKNSAASLYRPPLRHRRTRPRGHTSLSGAVEAQIAVKRGRRPGDCDGRARQGHGRGRRDFLEARKLDDLGTDPDGDPIRSFVVLPADQAMLRQSRTSIRGLSSQQRVALDALTECTAEHGKAAPASCELPGAVRGVTLEQWRAQLYRVGVLEPDEKKNPRTAFKRLQNSLQARKAIGIMDSFVLAGVAPVAGVASVAPYKGGATCYATAALA